MSDSDQSRDPERIFDELLDLPAERRERELEKRCAGDEKLADEVRSLLEHADQGGELFDKPLIPRDPHERRLTDPERIGHYRILGRLGDGGFGVVYEAEQTEPVRRRVALKILKAGMDTEALLARFEAERQALALMEHPHIAAVYESGATDNGRPYFAMELVRGEPITSYCDHQRLRIQDRLKLMIAVCRAVLHAHQRGIVHRDLKPSNVLVSIVDGEPTPKIIDFGIAKATAARLTDRTLHTQMGQLIGTPIYMSPEQAARGGLDVDTTTDIYSLGVILYELMCGHLPFDAKRLGTEPARVQRILQEVEPERPSKRAAVVDEENLRRARLRGSHPVRLAAQLKGELDWIVVKAMEKDRLRRYATAQAFADDLQRVLDDQPIVARPPSVSYRLRKFASRNRFALAMTAVVAVSLIMASVGLSVALHRARNLRAEAEAARLEAEGVTEFLTEMISAVRPDELGRDVTVREMLDQAGRSVGARFAEQPQLQARLRGVIGRTYGELGDYEPAERQLQAAMDIQRREFGASSLSYLEARSSLAKVAMNSGKYEEAVAEFEAILAELKTHDDVTPRELIRAESHVSQALLYANRLDDALAVLQPLADRARQEFGEDDELTSIILADLGMCHMEKSEYEIAEPLLRASVEWEIAHRGRYHSSVLTSQSTLGSLYREMGQLDKARELYWGCWEGGVELLGEKHPTTLRYQSNLALFLSDSGKYDEALEHSLYVLQAREGIFGDENPQTLATRLNLALLYHRMERYEDARREAEAAVKDCESVFGREHLYTILADYHVGKADRALGNAAASVSRLRDATSRSERTLGPDHWRTAYGGAQLALSMRALDPEGDWKAQFDASRSLLVETFGAEHRAVVEIDAELERLQ